MNNFFFLKQRRLNKHLKRVWVIIEPMIDRIRHRNAEFNEATPPAFQWLNKGREREMARERENNDFVFVA